MFSDIATDDVPPSPSHAALPTAGSMGRDTLGYGGPDGQGFGSGGGVLPPSLMATQRASYNQAGAGSVGARTLGPSSSTSSGWVQGPLGRLWLGTGGHGGGGAERPSASGVGGVLTAVSTCDDDLLVPPPAAAGEGGIEQSDLSDAAMLYVPLSPQSQPSLPASARTSAQGGPGALQLGSLDHIRHSAMPALATGERHRTGSRAVVFTFFHRSS